MYQKRFYDIMLVNRSQNLNLTKECDYMKKMIVLVLALVCVLGLVGCNSKNYEDKPQVVGSIKEIHDGYILIATSTTEGHPYGASFDVSINTKDCDEIPDSLAIGDEIIIYYDGKMATSDPAQINTVYAIKLKDQ